MAFPTVYVSLHSINVLSANAPGGLGNPVIITVKGYGGDTQLALHVPTKEYAQRLATGINDAVQNSGSIHHQRRVRELEDALHAAFMAMCAQRDTPDDEVFQDAIDALGMAGQKEPVS